MESLLVHPTNKEQSEVLKMVMKPLKVNYEDIKKAPYNEDFIVKMEKEEKGFSKGDYTTISLDDI